MTRGRPRKPDAQKLLEGNPRRERLGGELLADGKPKRPKRMSKDAGWMWDQVAQSWCGEIDTAALIAMCNLWDLRQRTERLLMKNPTDKDTRVSYINYHQQWAALASRFGLTPSDRAKIRLPSEPQKDDDEQRFFGLIG
jgi:phage terminase small subunit